jgi:hypothetical protein
MGFLFIEEKYLENFIEGFGGRGPLGKTVEPVDELYKSRFYGVMCHEIPFWFQE